jgi:hypothetical protein
MIDVRRLDLFLNGPRLEMTNVKCRMTKGNSIIHDERIGWDLRFGHSLDLRAKMAWLWGL